MKLEDACIIDGEGWSILTDVIGIPNDFMLNGELVESEITLYKFYSIRYDRFFTVPKQQMQNAKPVKCCRLVESEEINIGDIVLWWEKGPKLERGKVIRKDKNMVSLKTDEVGMVMQVNDLLVVKFEHEFLPIEDVDNVELCRECKAIRTERVYAV